MSPATVLSGVLPTLSSAALSLAPAAVATDLADKPAGSHFVTNAIKISVGALQHSITGIFMTTIDQGSCPDKFRKDCNE
jgi:hypothetical protein